MAKFFTIVVKFEDGVEPENIGFKEPMLGGEVVGIAAYDAIAAFDIAEMALKNSFDASCDDAIEKRIQKCKKMNRNRMG